MNGERLAPDTHTAVVLLLLCQDLSEWRKQLCGDDGEPQIMKLDKSSKISALMADANAPFVVFGATTWTVHKQFFDKTKRNVCFDLLLIDEGSQVHYAFCSSFFF